MNQNNAVLEIIKDVREYLLSLKETSVDEIGMAAVLTKQQQLQMLRDKIGDCRRCKLWSGRTNIVFGTGSPDARLMFVGEGPGQEEDRQGKPFVGRAGELDTKTRISDLRGRIHESGKYKIVATFHPAYLLRNPNEKRRAWEDLQLVMKELGMNRHEPGLTMGH